MKKRRIVLASLLKPVDDTRMFEKIGKSLSKNPDYEIFIIGYPSKKTNNDLRITFIPMDSFSRLSLNRVLTRFKILKNTIQVKPDILIVNSHELLIVAVLNRILFGTKIIYDVQENYWRNILWTNAFPQALRPLIALGVRVKEMLFAPFFHQFFLAEKSYEKELNFIGQKYLVLENKSQLPADFHRQETAGNLHLIFTGTLSKSTGVMEAISLACHLHDFDSSIRLTLIGYCALKAELAEIKNAIKGKLYITLLGGENLVPHQEIIDQIARANFGIISYPLSPHLEDKIPTKLYEYLHARLPILIRNHAPWKSLCEPFQAAILVDFDNLNPAELISKMKSQRFYETQPSGVTWADEEPKLLVAIEKFLI